MTDVFSYLTRLGRGSESFSSPFLASEDVAQPAHENVSQDAALPSPELSKSGCHHDNSDSDLYDESDDEIFEDAQETLISSRNQSSASKLLEPYRVLSERTQLSGPETVSKSTDMGPIPS